MIADTFARYASLAFDASTAGTILSFFEAWRGSLAYSLQLYFDFSGYSDMAIGLAYMFGIVLPLNFNSPYKAVSIIDFWRRWHMTLSRFLRDYVYIPLGGNRKGPARRQVNLLLTMLIGGLWHGAAWTFVIWGGLHGLFLIINHLWRGLKCQLGFEPDSNNFFRVWSSRLLTFLAITIAWVYFRAENLGTANEIVSSMFGMNGIVWPGSSTPSFMREWLISIGWEFSPLRFFNGSRDLLVIFIVVTGVWLLPNSQDLVGKYRPALEQSKKKHYKIQWSPSTSWALVISFIALISILNLSKVSEFLYFQF